MIDKNYLVFDSFEAAKRYLLENPGGSMVRLDNNEGFSVKLTNIKQQKNSIKPIYSKTDLRDIIRHKSSEFDRKKLERKERISEINQRQSDELKERVKALKEIDKLATPKKINYNKEPLKNSYPKKKPQKAEADFKRYIDEPTGSREDFKKMRGKQHFGNKTGNH